MTCIKTGCVTYFENYGMAVRGDLYQVGRCYVVRWNGASREYRGADPNDYIVQYWKSDLVWHREDLGVTVVPEDFFVFP